MAETAPLTIAQAHARKAAEQTQQLKWVEAASEHETAASNLAKAARATGDSEALRVLSLLEEQHLKLARVIRTLDSQEQSEAETTEPKQADAAIARRDFASSKKSTSVTSTSAGLPTSPLAAARLGSQVRESSPSLARDIASRRGIPQPGRNPPSAAAQARARQLSPESHRRNRPGPAPSVPPSVLESQALQQARKAKKAEDDDAFAKFYSTLTTGTMSKLSSVLAYAGLPLTADDIQPELTKSKLNKRTVSASNEPDVKKIFSKAALNAIEDEHRHRGTQGHVFGPAESFYVVQTGGGTYSYADIAKAKQQQQLSGIEEDDEESFVDAREAQAPTSPQQSRVSGQSRGAFGKSRTQEELELENTTLKTTLEQLATRLSDFEAHAQDASMAALTQSMASLNNQAPAGATDTALAERLRQIERQLEQQTEERQKLQNLAAKQEKTLKQYKAKWEDIKKSAREKERAKREKTEKGAEDAAAAAAAADTG